MGGIGKKAIVALLCALSLSAISAATADAANVFHPPRTIKRAPGMSAQIVGGTQVGSLSPNWPFIVSLWEYIEPDWYFLCAGSLVKPQWVVTAAHCKGVDPATGPFEPDAVLGGQNNLLAGDLVGVTYIAQHPRYDPATNRNDVMVLKTESVPASSSPVAGLASAGDDPGDGDPVNVAGWGDTVSGGSGTNDLREATVETVPSSTCDPPYAALHGTTQAIFPEMICAAHEEPAGTYSRDACQGDSGGPLTFGVKLAGIVSFGEGCANFPYAGVYTRVSAYRDWILDSTLGQLGLPAAPIVLNAAVPRETEASNEVTLTNTGGENLAISGASVTGEGMQLAGLYCPAQLAPGHSCQAYVRFAPSGAGEFAGLLTVASDAGNGAEQSVALTGTGLPPAAVSLRLERRAGRLTRKGGRHRLSFRVAFDFDRDPRITQHVCSSSLVARLKIRGTRSPKSQRAVLHGRDANCVSSVSFTLPKRALGRRATFSADFAGTGFLQRAKLRQTLKIRRPKSTR